MDICRLHVSRNDRCYQKQVVAMYLLTLQYQVNVNMIINKVQPDIIFNTSDTQLNHSNIQELTIQSIQDSDNPTLFDSQMGLTDVVYTIFTSGSTGEPKGVQIEYASLIEFAEWMVSLNESEGSQEWLNQAPFSFDLSVMAIYPCLTSGGTLNLVDKEMINKPKLLNEMLVNTNQCMGIYTIIYGNVLAIT